MSAEIGYGTIIEVETSAGSGTYTALSRVFEATPPSSEVDQVDVTHFGSPQRRREFIAGLTDSGTASLQMDHVPASATDVFVEAWRASGQTRALRLTYPNASSVTFSGYVLTYQSSIPLDDKMTASLEIKVTGAVTIVAAAIPVNLTVPAISGVADVGTTLTAFPGTWTGAFTFAYQWQEDNAGGGVWTNISGATAASYAPVAGQVGDRIRVGVVATNSAGSAAQVFSAPTIATVA